MHSVPALAEMFGVGEERPELEEAERLGMLRGSGGVPAGSAAEALVASASAPKPWLTPMR
jgi:hypothetical protein